MFLSVCPEIIAKGRGVSIIACNWMNDFVFTFTFPSPENEAAFVIESIVCQSSLVVKGKWWCFRCSHFTEGTTVEHGSQAGCLAQAHASRGRGVCLEDPGQAMNRTRANRVWERQGLEGRKETRDSMEMKISGRSKHCRGKRRPAARELNLYFLGSSGSLLYP